MRMPLFRGVKRWGKLISALLLCSLFLAACGENSPSVLNPSGPVADRERILFWFILIVATIVFVAVEGMLIYSIFRYRERPNAPMPRQIHGNNTIEVIWTVAPSIFLFAVLIGTIYTMVNLSQPKTPADLEVRVVGHQWWWEFDYVTQNNIVTADSLHVPTGAVVQLDLESSNVIHSFWIPQLTGKTDVIPGHHNQMWFTADHAGTYFGACAEFCGDQHANMRFDVVAEDPNTFQTWVSSEQQNAAAPAAGSLAEQGANLFAGSGGCTGCHGIVGVNLTSYTDAKANGLVGPNLTHFGSRRLIAGGVLSWDPNSCAIGTDGKLVNKDNCGLYKWRQDPQGGKPGNDMVIGQLTDTQITQLIAYLESLT